MTQDKIREKAEKLLSNFPPISEFGEAIDVAEKFLSDFRNEVIEEACDVFQEDLQCDEKECRRIYGLLVDRIRALKSQSTKDGEQ